jgi:DNA-directed RNA polymerase subunit E'/Rpb7
MLQKSGWFVRIGALDAFWPGTLIFASGINESEHNERISFL